MVGWLAGSDTGHLAPLVVPLEPSRRRRLRRLRRLQRRGAAGMGTGAGMAGAGAEPSVLTAPAGEGERKWRRDTDYMLLSVRAYALLATDCAAHLKQAKQVHTQACVAVVGGGRAGQAAAAVPQAGQPVPLAPVLVDPIDSAKAWKAVEDLQSKCERALSKAEGEPGSLARRPAGLRSSHGRVPIRVLYR
jgi:hypothetical protein